ncbi:MAG: hypothetical protein AAFX94_25600 [Myxococcota bacterium]
MPNRLLQHLLILLAVVCTVACGGSEPFGDGEIDEAMVGRWVGSLTTAERVDDGVLDATLSRDGSASMSLGGDSRAQGQWEVLDGRFRMRVSGGEGIDAQTIVLSAPRDAVELNGSYSTTKGRAGSFTCVKE